MSRTKRSRRFPAVYRGPDLTDPAVNLNEFDPEEIEYFLNASKLYDEELSKINFREIAEDVASYDLVGNDTTDDAILVEDAIVEVN